MRNFSFTDLVIVFFIIVIIIITILFAMDNAKNSLSDSEKKAYVNELVNVIEGYRTKNPGKLLTISQEGCIFSNEVKNCYMEQIFKDTALPYDPNNHNYIYKSSNGIDFTISAILSTKDYYLYDSALRRYLVLDPLDIIDGVCGSDNDKYVSSVPEKLCLSGTPSNVSSGENISLLLHMDGKNNKNAFRDNSGKEVAVSGDVETKTDIKKFGTASGYFNGSSYLSIKDSAGLSFGTEDFTIDFWVYLNDLKGVQTFIARGNNDFIANSNLMIRKNETNLIDAFMRDEAESIIGRIQGGILTEQEWHHIAYARKGNEFYLFLDGEKVGASNSSNNASNKSHELRIGAHNHDSQKEFLNGYIDELRILKGQAAWTGNFYIANTQYYWYNWKCNRGNGGIDSICGADN